MNKDNVELLNGEDDIITLYDDNDIPVDFYQVACVEHEDEFYAILQPATPLEGVADDEALVFKIMEGDDEDDIFVPVNDEALMDTVFNEYLKAVEEEIEIEQSINELEKAKAEDKKSSK